MPLIGPDGMTEADVTIEGVRLTFGQAMALRVAVSDFYQQMSDPNALGCDECGRGIAKGYQDRLGEVLRLMMGGREK